MKPNKKEPSFRFFFIILNRKKLHRREYIYINKEFINLLEQKLSKEDLIKLKSSINALLEVLTNIK